MVNIKLLIQGVLFENGDLDIFFWDGTSYLKNFYRVYIPNQLVSDIPL